MVASALDLFNQMEALEHPRVFVDPNQGFRFPGEPRLSEEYIMVYANGWIYIELEDQDVGHIWRYDIAGIWESVNLAYYDGKVSYEEGFQYIHLLQAIEQNCRFKKHFFLWNYDRDVMMTLDTYIMSYAHQRERVFELPNLIPDDMFSLSTITPVDSVVDSVFIELYNSGLPEPFVFDHHFDTIYFDWETLDDDDTGIETLDTLSEIELEL